jgi:Flp pilus assembly pilin Flp
MHRMSVLRRLGTAQAGGIQVEYGLMVFLIAVALITVVQLLSSQVMLLFSAP